MGVDVLGLYFVELIFCHYKSQYTLGNWKIQRNRKKSPSGVLSRDNFILVNFLCIFSCIVVIVL